MRKKEYYVLIEEVLKDSPAFKAGIKPLDRIISVDSGSVKGLDISEAVNKIKGPQGTKVHLVIERINRKDKDKKEFLEISVTRDKLQIPSVTSKILTGSS
ncbi:MAG: PDZ domain-containing protein [bacterium]|nr:PDZ domain-containing protein [bacterium]